MRISTSQIFDAGALNIQQSQSALYKLQNQLSTGRRVLTPQDDPVAAAQALVATQSMEVNAQYLTNQGQAKSQLGLVESQLASLINVLQDVRERVIQAGNTTLSQSDRLSVAEELDSRLSEILGIANSDNGVGEFLFSGYKGNVRPFAIDASLSASPPATDSPVGYFGDEGERLLQVSSSRQMAVSVAGSELFMSPKEGNGTFVTAAGGNVGVGPKVTVSTVTASSGSIIDQSQWAATWNNAAVQPLTISFPDATHYQIVDSFGNATAPALLVSGGSTTIPLITNGGINLGAQVVVSGIPVAGDSFVITPTATSVGVGVRLPTSTVTANAGSIVNRQQWTAALDNAAAGQPLTILFPDATHYQIVDSVGGTTAPIAYVNPTTIPLVTNGGVNFGAQVVVSGVPVAGDKFTVQPSINHGTAIIDAGSVLDQQKWALAVNNAAAGQPVEIRFVSVAGVMNYAIYDPVGGQSTLRPYSSGQTIPLVTAGGVDFGAQVLLNGQPSAGDTFTIDSSKSQSLFQTMQNLLGILRSPIGSATYTTTQFSNEIGAELTNIDQALDNISSVQAVVGIRMQEIESLGSSLSDLDVQYKATLSDLQDLDYAKAISDFMKQQMNLEAAQKSFAQVSGMSLFNYL